MGYLWPPQLQFLKLMDFGVRTNSQLKKKYMHPIVISTSSCQWFIVNTPGGDTVQLLHPDIVTAHANKETMTMAVAVNDKCFW